MKIRLLIFFLFVFSGLKAQTVTVTNVEQDGQKLVVSYDITGGTGKYEVALFCSTDDGTTWAGPLKSVSGDVGKNIDAGQAKKITWTVLNDRADLKSDNVRFKVKAWKDNGTVSDIDGNVYKTVKIGSQIWMKENLKVSRYQNGDPIPTNLSHNEWEKTTSGAFAIYDNDAANNTNYGKLYNWYAVTDSRGLCPVDWHVPSEEEWIYLEDFINKANIAKGKKRESNWWRFFSGLRGGRRSNDGHYNFIAMDGFWWSTTEITSGCVDLNQNAIDLALNKYFFDLAFGGCNHKQYGYSVRCLRD
jgi:uncharacterized protein (TIGR02145 family)